MKIKIKKGDKVVVIKGKDKNKVGVVTAILPKENKVAIEGVNVRVKHQKPNNQDQQGGLKQIIKPIPVANVMLLDPTVKIKDKKDSKGLQASRVSLKREKDPKTNKMRTKRYFKKGNIEM